MSINIFEWSTSIPRVDLGQQVQNRTTLQSRLRSVLYTVPPPVPEPLPANLQGYADMYGEQVTVDALADLNRYFLAISSRRLTLGGLPTGFSPLSILSRGLRPSNTAISVLGEGLAGWYLERNGLIPLARPVATGADLVFTNPTRAERYLVQATGTQRPGTIRDVIRNRCVEFLQFAHNVLPVTSSRYSCILVGVEVTNSSNFDIFALHISLP